MKRMILIILLPFLIASTNFEELEKAPEGAHENQLLIGGYISFGYAGGSIIDAENEFLDGSTYTFTESGTTKYLEATHLAFNLGISTEYMPINYIGIKGKINYTNIVQRTKFGSDYSNSKGTLYKDYGFLVGPAFHLTKRKPWDIVLNPMVGISYATFTPITVGRSRLPGFSYSESSSFLSYTYGAELNCTIYFSGGLYISLGGQYLYHNVKFDKITEVNPQTGTVYMDGGSSGGIYTLDFIFSAGYAFYN